MQIKKKTYVICSMIVSVILSGICICGCQKTENDNDFTDTKTREELYQAALQEDGITLYSVSSRAFETKETFEKTYPGLTVDVKDIRGNDVIDMVLSNEADETQDADVIICSDCDGSLYEKLLKAGIVKSYIPYDMKDKLIQPDGNEGVEFLGESMMFFYNTEVFEDAPITNIWELTEEKYKGKIIMANPLSSFSTYGFTTALFTQEEKVKQAYQDYSKEELYIPEGENAGALFWEKIAPNIVFTNSSDEVLEGIGNEGENGMWIGIMISSKMRYEDRGYHFAPIYQLNPFAAVYTPNCITIVHDTKNINTSKLFVRFILGEADGTGEGLKPFLTKGTWSTRLDVQDGNQVPLSDIDYVRLNKPYIYENNEELNEFWIKTLRENVTQ